MIVLKERDTNSTLDTTGLFNPNLWNIEYLPEENKFNMAVIIQGDAD